MDTFERAFSDTEQAAAATLDAAAALVRQAMVSPHYTIAG